MSNPKTEEIVRIERLEQHKDDFKKTLKSIGDDVRDVKDALLGSPLKADEGLVSQVKTMRRDIEDLETFKSEVSVYLNQSKFVIGALLVAVIGLIISHFKHS